ncbi:hypothetical protein [Streptomyces sp. NPDC101115]|uniref:hypothetical protein n=1 Tax=Streptomyces sp. NPDC101115 TaxID=3366106 RepID=UPI0038072A4E
MSMSDIDWGDFPTWMAGIFAGIAAIAAGWTLKSQRDQIREQREFIGEQQTNLHIEREILRADADERRRGQARQVEMGPLILQDVGPGGAEGQHWRVTAVNRSAEPIHEVSVHCGADIRATSARLSGGANQGSQPRTAPIEILGSNCSAKFETDNFPQGVLGSTRPVLFFTDNARARWRLDEHGDLSQVEPEPSS